MRRSVLLTVSCFLLTQFNFIYAQTNLITNGSFENYSGTCPTFAPNGALIQAYNWFVPDSLPTHGIPHAELYCGEPNYGNCLPGPFPLVGSDGLAYVGFHTRILTPVYNEAIVQVLNTPLIQGKSYTISMDLMDCQTGLFTTGPSDLCVYTNIDTLIPACPSSGPSVVLAGCVPFDSISNSAWKHHSFSFVAPANANVIAFSGGACFTSEVYYYLDNIVLISNDVQASHTCLGDSTFFSIGDTAGILTVDWNFDDPASGINNISSLFNPVHLYSLSGNYQIQLIKHYATLNDTVSFNLTVFSNPVINLGADTAFCTGSIFQINAGSGFLSYVWQDSSQNTNFNATQAGLYFVTVMDGNCMATDSIQLSTISCSTPGVNFYASDTSFCGKKCIDFFDISTNNPTSWQWYFPGADSTSSNLQNPGNICYNSYGSFDVTLIACNAAGCDTLILSGFINEFNSPAVPVITANFDTLFSTPAFAYQWYSGLGAIPGATASFYVSLQPGSYYVVVFDSNGCAASSIVVTTSIIENSAGNSIVSVNPNPANDLLVMHVNKVLNLPVYVSVYNVTGQKLSDRIIEPGHTKIEFNVAAYDAGLYLITWQSEAIYGLVKFVVLH